MQLSKLDLDWMLCKLCRDSEWIMQPPFSQLLSIFKKTNKCKMLEKFLGNWSLFKSGQFSGFKAREVVCKLSFRLSLIQFPLLQSGEDTIVNKSVSKVSSAQLKSHGSSEFVSYPENNFEEMWCFIHKWGQTSFSIWVKKIL